MMRWRTEYRAIGGLHAIPATPGQTLHLFRERGRSLCGAVEDTSAVVAWGGTGGPGFVKCSECKAQKRAAARAK